MTGTQYKKALASLGISQREAALFLGVHHRTSAAWATGERDIPEAVAKLLRLMIRSNLKPEDVK